MRMHPYEAAEQLHFQVVLQFKIPAPLLEQETSEVACQRENHSELRVFSQPELILITVLTGA